MECRKCQMDLTGVEHRMVAQWPFCVPCFEELLATPRTAPPAEEPAATPAAIIVDATPMVEPAVGAREIAKPTPTADVATCRLCDGVFPASDMVHLGFWRFCPACIQDVVENPEPPPALAVEAQEDRPEPIRPAPLVWVNCARCGRRVPDGGAKRIDGEPYCPDCHHALAPPPPLPDLAALAAPEPGAAAGSCEACGRETPGETPLRVEAYRICRACLRSDPDLALELAAVRHRRQGAARS